MRSSGWRIVPDAHVRFVQVDVRRGDASQFRWRRDRRLGDDHRGGWLCPGLNQPRAIRRREAEMTDTDSLREKLMDAAIAHVPFDGWGDKALLAAAKDLGVDEALARNAVPG